MQSKEILLFIVIIFLIFPTINLSFSQRSSDPKNDSILLSASDSNITTNQSAPLNPDIIQITVRNDTSANSKNDVQIMALYGNAITAVGAIAGGVVGSLLTYRHNRK